MTTDITPYEAPGTPAPYDRPAVPRISSDIVRPRLPEVGRIRLGVKGSKMVNRGGKQVEVTFPTKLDRFRFTSRDRSLIESVAALYGGTVEPWASDEGPQWQVTTDATTIPVVVPRAQLAFSQYFENWEGAVCRRRCDGVWDQVRECRCTCVDRDRECLPTTRLSVLLPSVPGLGVWRVESHGFNAAAEILGTIELAAAYGAALLPANLTLAQRTKRRPDPKTGQVVTNRFVVPVLSITASVEDMVGAAQLEQARRLGVLPSVNERASDDQMKALRVAVFTRWPESVDEPYRADRLAFLSQVIGRDILTISKDHDLAHGEVTALLDYIAALPEDTDLQDTTALPSGHPAPAPAHPGAAPLQSSAGTAGPREATSAPRGIEAPEPAEHHQQSSAGNVVEPGRLAPSAPGTDPAEHHSEDDGHAAPRVQPVGSAASSSEHQSEAPGGQPATQDMTGKAAAAGLGEVTSTSGGPSAPKRTRTPDLEVEAQRVTAERAERKAIPRGPTTWRQTLPPAERGTFLAYFRGNAKAAEQFIATYAEQEGLPLLPWAEDTEWPADKLRILMESAAAEGSAK